MKKIVRFLNDIFIIIVLFITYIFFIGVSWIVYKLQSFFSNKSNVNSYWLNNKEDFSIDELKSAY